MRTSLGFTLDLRNFTLICVCVCALAHTMTILTDIMLALDTLIPIWGKIAKPKYSNCLLHLLVALSLSVLVICWWPDGYDILLTRWIWHVYDQMICWWPDGYDILMFRWVCKEHRFQQQCSTAVDASTNHVLILTKLGHAII